MSGPPAPAVGAGQGSDVRVAPAAALAWAVGLWVTGELPPAAAWTAAGALLVAAGVLAGVWSGRHAPRGGRRVGRRGPAGRGSAVGTVVVALTAAGAVAASGGVQLAQRESALGHLATATHVEGTVVGDPRSVRFGGTTRVRLELAAVVVPHVGTGEHVRVTAPPVDISVRGGPEWAEVPHGTVVRASGRPVPVVGEREVAELRAGPPSVVASPRGVAATVNRLRAGLVDAVQHLPADSRGLVPGAAVGDTRAVPADLVQAMRDTSLVHVTAVSGSHFSVVLAALLGLGAALRLPPAARAGATLAGVIGFTVLVQPGSAVLRAAVMGAVVVLGLVLGRPSRAVPALAWAVVALVCWDPWTARDVGFHLSVAATAAIVLLGPALAARMPGPRSLRTAVAVSVAAQAACGPLLVLLDPVLPLYGVPANLLAVPALLPATLGGLLATLAGPVAPWLAGPGLVTADLSVRWVAGVARGMAALPFARLPWPAGPGGAWLLAGLTTLALTVVMRLPRRDDRP